MKSSILFLAAILAVLSSTAQSAKWHAFEGFYRNPANEDMVWQFISTDTGFLAKPLWADREFHLMPDSDMAFVSRERVEKGHLRVVFQRGSSGTIDAVSVNGGEIWQRANNYKPKPPRQEMVHTTADLQKFVGLYHAKADTARYVELRMQGNGLKRFDHLDDGTLGQYVPDSPMSFFIKAAPFLTLKFTADAAGQITQYKDFNGSIWIKAMKPDLSPGQLKSYEGKFQSADDPDNLIQLVAEGGDIMVTELWNKKETRLQPLTNTYFNDGKLSFPLQIVLENGQVTKIIILGKETFRKVSR